jgi:hypothetical protein
MPCNALLGEEPCYFFVRAPPDATYVCEDTSYASDYAGALWHLGLEPDGCEILKAASAPRFLANAVPRTWIATDNDPFALPNRAESEEGRSKDSQASYDPTWDTPSEDPS